MKDLQIFWHLHQKKCSILPQINQTIKIIEQWLHFLVFWASCQSLIFCYLNLVLQVDP